MFRLSRIFFKMLYAVFSVVLASALASPRPDTITIKEIIGAEKVCLASFPPELKAVINELKSTMKMPENPSADFKCFINCMGKELGVIDEQGNYHFEKLKSIHLEIVDNAAPHDDVHKVVEECIAVDHDHACEKAHLYVQCSHEKLKHLDFHEDLKTSTN